MSGARSTGFGPVHVIRHADCPVMPWKNGGGSTTEIAVFPRGAGLDAVDWRVSMADVAADGPFSSFPGIDRTLAILSGAGLRLAIGDAAPVALTGADAPLAFPADVPTRAWLLDGPVTDLNVMTRRGRFRHVLARRALMAGDEVAGAAPLTILLAAQGPADLVVDGRSVRLEERDVLLGGGSQAAIIVARAPCRVLVAEIAPA